MINNPKETEFPPGEEGNSSEIGKVNPKVSSSAGTANPTPWLRLRDPRIVRVSRVFGGKDRHSKVCTIRGLRDRRVRLSVPTAIQLYDLQDRLGLNQPSKVVDWLLSAAKHEIDELPPLPMPLAGSFSLLTPPEANIAAAAASQSNNEGQGVILKNNNSNEMGAIEWELGSSSRPNFWTSTATATSSPTSSNALWRATSKEVARDNNERENWRSTSTTTTTRNEVEKREGNEGGNSILQGNEGGNSILPQRTNNHPFFPGTLNNIAHVPNSANYRWELPNYQLLSHLGGNHGFKITSQTDHIQHLQNVMSLQPSTLSLSTGSPFMLCPPGIASTSTTTQTYFPSQSSAANSVEIVDPRQVNHNFQMLSSNAAAQNLLPNPMMRPLYFGMSNSKQLVGFPPNDNIGSDQQQNKELE